MPSFDFIRDATFRGSLESDYAEMERCFAASSWKSTQVLAGSIVETLLIDYLAANTHPKRGGKDPLAYTLAEAIATCRTEGVLTERASDLSSVIRSYRNLIHPGRVVRLNEPAPDHESAGIARMLVDLIIRDVAKALASTFGLTAEQVARKVATDSDSLGILRLLLNDVHAAEKNRLLLGVLPQVAAEAAQLADDPAEYQQIRQRFAKAFRMVFDACDDPAKSRVALKFVSILRESDGATVREYRDLYFSPLDLKFLEEKDRLLVLEHYLATSPKAHDEESADTFSSLAPFLGPNHVTRWVDPFMVPISNTATSEKVRSSVRELLLSAVLFATPAVIDDQIVKRVDDWIAHFEKLAKPDRATLVRKLKAEVEEFRDLPF